MASLNGAARRRRRIAEVDTWGAGSPLGLEPLADILRQGCRGHLEAATHGLEPGAEAGQRPISEAPDVVAPADGGEVLVLLGQNVFGLEAPLREDSSVGLGILLGILPALLEERELLVSFRQACSNRPRRVA